MTALVAQNMELKNADAKTALDHDKGEEKVKEFLEHEFRIPKTEVKEEPIDAKIIISEVSKIHPTNEELEDLAKLLNAKKPIEKPPVEDILGRTEEEINHNKELEKEEFLLQKKKQEEYQKTVDFIMKESPTEEVPPEHIPHYSDEELQNMFMDEYEKTGTYHENEEPEEATEVDLLDEEADRLTYPVNHEPQIDLLKELAGKIEVDQHVESEIEVSHTNGLVEGISMNSDVIPEPVLKTSSEEDEKKKLEDQRLERIRQIAQDNLKKK
jgi:hypothetical protein